MTQRRYLTVLLLLLGIGVMLWSAHDFFALVRGDRSGASICVLNSYWNCDRASFSLLGNFFLIPIGIFGAAWFFTVGLLIFSRLRWRDVALKVFFGLAIVSCLVLGSYLVFELKTGCVVCYLSYVLIGFLVLWEWPRKENEEKGFGLGLRRLIATLFVGLGILGAYAAYMRITIDGDFPEAEFKRWFARTEPMNFQEGLAFDQKKGKIVVVEFSDFGCPFCSLAAETTVSFLHEQPDVSIFFFPFPLDASCNPDVQRTLHPYSCDWALGAICAEAQGKLWDFHERIFRMARRLGALPLFSSTISEFDIDLQEMESCLRRPETKERLQKMMEVARQASINSTPTFLLAGRRFEGYMKMPLVRRILEELRK